MFKMDGLSLLRVFTVCSMIVAFTSHSYAETPDGTTLIDAASGDGEGSAGGNCTACMTAEPCPSECTCPEGQVKDIELICAEPCSEDQNWCETEGETCLPGGENGYICAEPCSEGQNWCGTGSQTCLPGGENGYICAEPCKGEYSWCSGAGQVCVPLEGDFNCSCGPNYYLSEESCISASVFRGEMTFNDSFIGENTGKVQPVLNDIFGQILGFIQSEILNTTSGSIIVTYKLIYDTNFDVTDSDIEDAFEEYTEGNCSAGDSTASTKEGLTINCMSKDTINSQTAACEEFGSILNCSTDTTKCKSVNGDTQCFCKEDDSRLAKPDPEATFCTAATCIEDNDCNPPFGKCEKPDSSSILNNYCKCTVFGWSGTFCTNPWEFVFTIVTAGLGLILICVLTACIITSKKGKTVKKTPKHEDMDLQNPFVDFQPGLVRAKVPTNAYSLSDSYEATNGAQSHTNGAFNANEGSQMHTSTFSGEQRRSGKQDYEYF